jgi:hypothetical protein
VFVFRMPEEHMPELATVAFGGPEPSELLDPGDWMRVFQHAEESEFLSSQEYEYAAAALDEIAKFIPPDADEVPVSEFRSDETLAVYAREPGRFSRGRLAAVAEVYRQMAAEARALDELES